MDIKSNFNNLEIKTGIKLNNSDNIYQITQINNDSKTLQYGIRKILKGSNNSSHYFDEKLYFASTNYPIEFLINIMRRK